MARLARPEGVHLPGLRSSGSGFIPASAAWNHPPSAAPPVLTPTTMPAPGWNREREEACAGLAHAPSCNQLTSSSRRNPDQRLAITVRVPRAE